MESRRYVEGYALDEDDKPLADVWVHVEGRSQMDSGTASDSTGHFAFWLPRMWLSQSDATLIASNGQHWVNKIPITDKPITIRFGSSKKKKK